MFTSTVKYNWNNQRKTIRFNIISFNAEFSMIAILKLTPSELCEMCVQPRQYNLSAHLDTYEGERTIVRLGSERVSVSSERLPSTIVVHSDGRNELISE